MDKKYWKTFFRSMKKRFNHGKFPHNPRIRVKFTHKNLIRKNKSVEQICKNESVKFTLPSWALHFFDGF